MILFPAVDIKDGQCVRLRQGKADQVTVFSADPVAMAEHWIEKGASWIHVVDLDGAFSGMPKNFELIQALCTICTAYNVNVQLGGGVRDAAIAKAYLDAGVARLIVGTLALEDSEAFAALCTAFPQKIGVSLDAVDGNLKTRGWVGDTTLTVDQAVPKLVQQGAAFFVYTDISRDGMQSGVNINALAHLLELTELDVIAAGGVTTLEDVKQLHALEAHGLAGAITGRAIYEGTLDLGEAFTWLAAQGLPKS